MQRVQLVLLVRPGRGRVCRGPGHVLIPPGPRPRAGPTQCRPFGSASGHMGAGRNLRRGATAGGESSLAARSCQSEAASRAGGDRWGAGGGTRGDVRFGWGVRRGGGVRRRGGVRPGGGVRRGGDVRPGHGRHADRPRGDRVVRHRGRPFVRLVGTHGLTAGRAPRLVRLSSGPPGFLARPRSPVNVLSGHSDENVGGCGAGCSPTGPGGAGARSHAGPRKSMRPAGEPGCARATLLSQKLRRGHGRHTEADLPSHPAHSPCPVFGRPRSPGTTHA